MPTVRRASLSITVLALLMLGSGMVVSAQSSPAPALAQDGRGLFNETPETRATFSAVWGDRASAEWIRQHDLILSGGNAPHGPRIGLLYAGAASANAAFTQGLANGLRAVGYSPGRDISIEWRFADGRPELLPALAAELVELRVDVIVATVLAESLAAKQATSTIPIVTLTVSNPVTAGLAESLDRPGGNVTGVIQQPLTFDADRFAFIAEAVPHARRIAVLANVATPDDPLFTRLRDLADPLGFELQTFALTKAEELPGAFDSVAEHQADALMVQAGTLFTANRSQIVRLATEHHVPTLYPSRLFMDEGGLMDYAFVEASRGRAAAEYVAQILGGAKPADLPMRPPPEVELVVNLKAAQAIGFSVPPSVLDRATEVIP